MRSRWPDRIVFYSILLASVLASAQTQLYRLTPSGDRRVARLALADDVSDPVFSLLTYLVEEEVFGHLTLAALDSVVQAAEGSVLPYDRIRSLERRPAPGDWHATIEVLFEDDFEADVPYSLLGYHPGSLRADPELELYEWDLGRQTFWVRQKDDTRERVVVDDARLFGVHRGRVELDVAWFLDRFLGGKLDDVIVTGFAFLRIDGTPYGLAFGYNKKGRGRTGVFDFSADDVVFPAPRHFLSIGRTLRGRMEALLTRLDTETASEPGARDDR